MKVSVNLHDIWLLVRGWNGFGVCDWNHVCHLQFFMYGTSPLSAQCSSTLVP